MKNILIGIVGLILIGGLAYAFMGSSSMSTPTESTETSDTQHENAAPEGAQIVAAGTYAVDPEASEFNFAGKKPLIDGYVNSGSIDLSKGTITVSDTTATGSFTLDMNTLHVGLTAKKPGQESALEGHLKGKGWFDVATYPTASFVITKIEPTASSATTFEYTVTGNLTLKGTTNEITFPALIYQAADGKLHAHAETEIDRTKWGLTAGSKNFFDNVGDNMIDDMVAISFAVIAQKQ